MDGRSIVPLLIDPAAAGVVCPSQTAKHVRALAPQGAKAFRAAWRDSVFVEYYFNSPNAKCTGGPLRRKKYKNRTESGGRGGRGDFSSGR